MIIPVSIALMMIITTIMLTTVDLILKITLVKVCHIIKLFIKERKASKVFNLLKGIDNKTVRNGILLPKLSWPIVRKNCSTDREKNLKFEAEHREFAKKFRSLEQFWIYSNRERSEKFLVRECFFNLFLEGSHI